MPQETKTAPSLADGGLHRPGARECDAAAIENQAYTSLWIWTRRTSVRIGGFDALMPLD